VGGSSSRIRTYSSALRSRSLLGGAVLILCAARRRTASLSDAADAFAMVVTLRVTGFANAGEITGSTEA
jgi:hypothetical protein